MPSASSGLNKPIRALVYGVGRLNQLATRFMLEKGVEVVGAINRSGPKVGQDLGELAGLARLGVVISDDAASVLSTTTADVALVGVYDDIPRMFDIYRACLEQGMNVISFGAHASYPWRMEPEPTQALDEIAKANRASISGIGNQDFFMINLGTVMSGVSHRIERITHRSLTNVNNFGAEVAEIAYVGESPEALGIGADNQSPSVYTTFWDNVAADLELTVLDIIQTLQPVVADKTTYCRSRDRSIEPGKLIGIVQRLDVVTAEGLPMAGENGLWICEPQEEEYKEWEIEGEPPLKIRATELDTGFTTASQVVNRIPHVIQAPPGYVTLEQLPKLTFRARLTLK